MACKNIILKLIVLSLSEATNFENLGRKLANNRKLRNRRRRKIFLNIRTRKMMLRNIPKNTNFLKTIKEFPDDVFQTHFRMTRSTFQFVANELKPFWKNSNSGRPSIDMRLALYLTLWKLANNCSFREISCLFNIAKGSTFKYFFQTTKLLFKLRKIYIKWPDSIHEQLEIMNSFASLRNNPFPNVLGCVDGTQIPIIAPKTDPTSYFNRKGTFLINMQGICDHNQKFIDICFGYPGSCHDASVWERSSIGKALQSGSKKIMQDGNILGDSAYPLNLYLMVPYRDNGYLTATQKTYNFVHSSTRVGIEQAFGKLLEVNVSNSQIH